MPRLALKPDSSFFRKITIGAVGSRAICNDLSLHGHEMVELERGSTETKLWKEVKRKRVRIPDLVCLRCGQRAESRAKTKAELAMSHSATDDERAWDFGMTETDLIGFPVCEAVDEKYWSAGSLESNSSYWHERNWVKWEPKGHINYFRVGAFRAIPPTKTDTKGVTEASETSISWHAHFSSRNGVIEAVMETDRGRKITIKPSPDGRRIPVTVSPKYQVFVKEGDAIRLNQVISGPIKPAKGEDLACPGKLADGFIDHLLHSRERTLRFTGVKLARLQNKPEFEDAIADLAADAEEDVYIRLEGLSYLTATCNKPARELFRPYLESVDQRNQLEAVIALAEASNGEAIQLLSEILESEQPYFLRSAAAWGLSRAGETDAASRLIAAFADLDRNIREESLEGIVAAGGLAVPLLLKGLCGLDSDVAAGCAEALRRQRVLSRDAILQLSDWAKTDGPWAAWLLGNLPREQVTSVIADLQDSSPPLHYALTLLWSFTESWIARRWEVHPEPAFPAQEDDALEV